MFTMLYVYDVICLRCYIYNKIEIKKIMYSIVTPWRSKQVCKAGK